MFLSWLGEPGRHGDVFLLNGGKATIESYGFSPAIGAGEAKRRIPETHLAFLRNLPMKHLREPFLFVHAGISPGYPLDDQRNEDLLWIREEFIRNRHTMGHTVVFGHTPHREVLWHVPWKIGIDTGCVYGNKLTCLELRSATLLEVRRGSGRVTRRSVATELGQLEGLNAGVDRV
jgi:serine/threonine protein phosphatase 1